MPSLKLALYSASFFAALVGPSYDPASLTWQPQGRHQPARVQAAAPWNDTSVFGAPVYDPQELQWVPRPAWPLRLIAPVRAGYAVLDPLPRPGVAFDPALFPRSYPAVPQPPERRLLGDSVEPFFTALYKAEGLQWQPTGQVQPVRRVERGVQAWSLLDPFPLTVAFDPRLFPWTEARASRAPIERRLLGDSVEPFVAALYRPEGLQWQPAEWAKPQRGLVRGVQVWSLLNPNPLGAFFDPATLTWQPSDRVPARVLAAIRTGASILNPLPIAPPFNAAHLAWLPSARPYPRQLVASRLGVFVVDPFPRPPSALALVVADAGDYRYLVTDQGEIRLALWDAQTERYIAWDASANRLFVWDASGHRYWVEDV